MSLIGIDTSNAVPEKKPTLRQFLKLVGQKKLPKIFPVFVIWTPGAFNSFTIETEKFRILVPSGNAVYNQLQAEIEELTLSDSTIAIEILDRKKNSWTFAECKEPGSWTELGSSGYRFENG